MGDGDFCAAQGYATTADHVLVRDTCRWALSLSWISYVWDKLVNDLVSAFGLRLATAVKGDIDERFSCTFQLEGQRIHSQGDKS